MNTYTSNSYDNIRLMNYWTLPPTVTVETAGGGPAGGTVAAGSGATPGPAPDRLSRRSSRSCRVAFGLRRAEPAAGRVAGAPEAWPEPVGRPPADRRRDVPTPSAPGAERPSAGGHALPPGPAAVPVPRAGRPAEAPDRPGRPAGGRLARWSRARRCDPPPVPVGRDLVPGRPGAWPGSGPVAPAGRGPAGEPIGPHRSTSRCGPAGRGRSRHPARPGVRRPSSPAAGPRHRRRRAPRPARAPWPTPASTRRCSGSVPACPDRSTVGPDYLLDDGDAFADDRWFPPPVIGPDDLPPPVGTTTHTGW